MEQNIVLIMDPANTQRINHVIITSKRHFDVITTCLLRCVFAGELKLTVKFKLQHRLRSMVFYSFPSLLARPFP